MAKVEFLKVRFSELPDFTMSDFDIVKWLIEELEYKFMLVFETVVSEDKKETFLYQVEHLFNSVALLINDGGGIKLRKELEALTDEIASAKDFLKETDKLSGFFWERITTKWYIFKRKRTKFLIAKILAMYISEHPEAKDIKEKTLDILKNKIVDICDVSQKFHLVEIKELIPEKWPTTTNPFYRVSEVPYLKRMITEAKLGGYTEQEIKEAWNKMLKMKSQNKVYPEEFWFLTLDMAFYVLFRDLSYDETLMHGVAVECLAEDIKF